MSKCEEKHHGEISNESVFCFYKEVCIYSSNKSPVFVKLRIKSIGQWVTWKYYLSKNINSDDIMYLAPMNQIGVQFFPKVRMNERINQFVIYCKSLWHSVMISLKVQILTGIKQVSCFINYKERYCQFCLGRSIVQSNIFYVPDRECQTLILYARL